MSFAHDQTEFHREGPRETIDHDYNHVFKTLGPFQGDQDDINILIQ